MTTTEENSHSEEEATELCHKHKALKSGKVDMANTMVVKDHLFSRAGICGWGPADSTSIHQRLSGSPGHGES